MLQGHHQNEESYFAEMRRKGQVVRLPSGGEMIRASPRQVLLYPNRTFYPWERISECENYYTKFAPPGSLSPKALASFPSSGSSWLSDNITYSQIWVKKNHMEELNNEGIIIIRNPFMALVSHRHLDAGGHIGFAPEAHFEGEGWRSFVLLKIKLWKEFYMDWINNSKRGDLYVIFYEDLTSDVLEYLEKGSQFPIPSDRQSALAMYRQIPKGRS
ncbi:WSC domain-containing protein 1 [Armadillidium nasatum]|uniref:WSC domain-containing protein 1 n=1 Tax=Armadillidium nasatum TaxID=96803 RepID=A0A5N5TLR9_9CRUS|nr:WSC domain-containing protein 1 [Armadillidium nasatum]